MRIKNIRLRSIEAKRYINIDEQPKQINIKHKSSINQIRDIKENTAFIDFQYNAIYENVGIIKIEGSAICENTDAKEMINEWKKSRNIQNKNAIKIHSTIMHVCVQEAVCIAKNLNLPTPVTLANIKYKIKTDKDKIGLEIT
jgi:hypothetical protein